MPGLDAHYWCVMVKLGLNFALEVNQWKLVLFLGCFESRVMLLSNNDAVWTKSQRIKRRLLPTGMDSRKNSSETCCIWLQWKTSQRNYSSALLMSLPGSVCWRFCARLQAALPRANRHWCLPSPGYSDLPAPVHGRHDSSSGRQEPIKGTRGWRVWGRRGFGEFGFR